MNSTQLIFLIVLTGLLTCATTSAQTTYYVDPTHPAANDFNSGSAPSAPWATLSKVNAFPFSAGDSCLLRAGAVWNEQLLITRSGAPSAPITFGAFGTGARPAIDLLGASTEGVRCTAADVVIDGLHVRFACDGIWLHGAQRVVISDCELNDNSVYAIIGDGGGGMITVENCYFHDNLSDAVNAFITDAWTIRYNVIEGESIIGLDGVAFHDCQMTSRVYGNTILGPFGKAGVSCATTAGTSCSAEVFDNFITLGRRQGITSLGAGSEVLAYNNIIVMEPLGVDYATGAAIAAHNGGVMTAHNNTLVNVSMVDGPTLFAGPGATLTARNNISHLAGGGTAALHWEVDATAVVDSDFTLYDVDDAQNRFLSGGVAMSFTAWAGSQDADGLVGGPLLQTLPVVTAQDARLQPGSPAINAGMPLTALFTLDHFGTARPVGGLWDLGAHEEDSTVFPMVGSSEDFALHTVVNGIGDPNAMVKFIGVGDVLDVGIVSPGLGFVNTWVVLGIDVFDANFPPILLDNYPEVHLGANADLAESFTLLTASGLSFTYPITASAPGFTARLQAFSLAGSLASNGVFAATNGHDLVLQ